jgi:hypothetical protein
MTAEREPNDVYPDPELDPDTLVTNDAVAGETVLPGDPQGPEGGEPREASPVYAEDDLEEDRPGLTEDEVELN